MFLKNTKSGDMVEILDIAALIDPNNETVSGRYHCGEEMQESALFDKSELKFPSDESLPRCWVDSTYRS